MANFNELTEELDISNLSFEFTKLFNSKILNELQNNIQNYAQVLID